ncbi:glycoside hydrolase family 3 N-terminal domain-containing protein [Plantibacter sp. YIM 135347]|uniref:glycoside hydrolase family 3 N-terminal domain-containing protein n=1 Tax=Plantibacter sp. YIM 135347 TaxID=3423919 RepID=UPI003D33268D
MLTGLTRRTVLAAGAVLAAAALLTGCATSSGPTSSSSAALTPSATPTPESADAVRERRVHELLDGLTLEQKISSMLMLHVPGTDAGAIRSFVDTIQPGGLILMGDNMPGLDALPALTGALSPDPTVPLLIGIDEEGGTIQRIDEDAFANAESLKGLPAEETRAAFAGRGAMLAAAGCNVNFGIVADETADPSSFIYDRVLGTTPQDAADRVTAAVEGEHGTVLSTIKHFPGHGAAPGDSHSTLPSTPMSQAEWASTDALPFEAGIAAGADLVMFGHLVYSSIDAAPASLSPAWHDVLRKQLGFDGITITDDMLMLQHTGIAEFQDPSENAIRAVLAGNTMLLYVLAADPVVSGVDPAVLVSDLAAAVRSGRIPAQLVDDAAAKLLDARLRIGEKHAPGSSATSPSVAPVSGR